MTLTNLLISFALGVLLSVPAWLFSRTRNASKDQRPADSGESGNADVSPRVRDWQVFIERYEFPADMLDRALGRCLKGIRRSDLDTGLRQFFLACGSNASLAAAMPSKSVDEAWHEFITYTRDYADFCDSAFGQMLHHVPESTMTSAELATNHGTGMATAWKYACEQEGLSTFGPTAPVLFAVDARTAARTLAKRAAATKPLVYIGCCGSEPSVALEAECAAPQGTVCMLHTYADQWGRLSMLPARVTVPAPRSAVTGPAPTSGKQKSTKREDSSVAVSGDDGGIAALTILATSCGSTSSSDDSSSPSSCGSSSSSCGSSSSSCGSSSSSSSCGSSCGGGGD